MCSSPLPEYYISQEIMNVWRNRKSFSVGLSHYILPIPGRVENWFSHGLSLQSTDFWLGTLSREIQTDNFLTPPRVGWGPSSSSRPCPSSCLFGWEVKTNLILMKAIGGGPAPVVPRVMNMQTLTKSMSRSVSQDWVSSNQHLFFLFFSDSMRRNILITKHIFQHLIEDLFGYKNKVFITVLIWQFFIFNPHIRII